MLIPIAAKMFTPGRIVFASLFVIAFVVLMIYSYKKDAKNNSKHYKNGAIYVAFIIITLIALLFISKFLIKG
ncbi:hypothetical protein PG911_15510 [Tenacibaculum ovolyticum]|uniref:hypothetical protein n=1 Tax=Tenacibaculum ovolyticum TaxID=104270 RepID=UPI0022F3E47C|nr:hypothetical protein [Tenacibaculum ovolyticum]WBX76032.1 hypothetical protein PG911_15510 [Tenacibaculum ovolyticum]